MRNLFKRRNLIVSWTPEIPGLTTKVCDICGREFQVQANVWMGVLDPTDYETIADKVCLTCRITDPRGDIYKLVEQERRAKDSLQLKK